MSRPGDLAGAGIWEHFTVQDGLPDMKIECILEDSSGSLWFGTHDRGAVRYDGHRFTCYTSRDGLAGNGVFSAIEDENQVIWFGTNRGLSRFADGRFEVVGDGEGSAYLWGRCRDSAGALWFGMDRRPGLPPAAARWDGHRLVVVPIGNLQRPEGASLHAICADASGDLWFGGDGLWSGNPVAADFTEATEYEALGEVSAILPGPDGRLWFACDNGLWVHGLGGPEALMSERHSGPVSLSVDLHGTYWVVTYDGRVLCSDGTTFVQTHRIGAVHRGGLCCDRWGRVWVGTYGMGVYCQDRDRFRVYKEEHGLPANSVTCVAVVPDGGLLVGTSGGIRRLEQGVFTEVAGAQRISDKGISGLLPASDGVTWVGTRNGWLYRYDGQLARVDGTPEDLRGYSVCPLAEDDEGQVWFGSQQAKGFGYVGPQGVHYFPATDSGAHPSSVRAIIRSSHGGVWLGSSMPATWDGLCRYEDGGFERVEGFSGSPIMSLCEDMEGRLWVGSNEGVGCFDEHYTLAFKSEDGLPSEIITALHVGPMGRIWIGTEGGGIGCYDGSTFQVLQVPGDPACNVVRAMAEDNGGVLWICTEGGLLAYSPRSVRPSVEVFEVVADTTYASPTEVQFPLTVGRVVLCFRGRSPHEHSKHLVYRFRLKGHEDEWRQTVDNEAAYTGIVTGDYLFEVVAVDRDMNYSHPACVTISVTEDPRIAALTDALRSQGMGGEIIGASQAIEEVRRQLREVAWTDLTVLVLGETGTGKGLAARAVHDLSERHQGSFIHVDCGALQEGLVDSELFGHERGAFTGAVSRRLGKFELADKGTIFLDEIGDLPLESQTRLLRVLQEKCIERVGGTGTISVDVRVIAATNRDLVGAVRANAYRADLYYRLNVFPIRMPALRERLEDIPLLSGHFVKQFAGHLNREPPEVGDEAQALFQTYDWPGNVRELEHTLQRAVILARSGVVTPEHIAIGPPVGAEAVATGTLPIVSFAEFERRYLEHVLDHTGGVIHGPDGAANLLGMKPTTLRSRLERLGLKKRRPRG